MIRVKNDVRIEGIRQTNAGGWAVVGSEPVACRSQSGLSGQRKVVLIREWTGAGAKAYAIEAAGTNRLAPSAAQIAQVAA